jgi:hypothetical protein
MDMANFVTACRMLSSIVPLDLAAHGVGDGDVHVGRCQRGGHRLEPVADREHHIRLQLLENGRQFEKPQSGRLRHRVGVSPSISMWTRAWALKPSASISFATDP